MAFFKKKTAAKPVEIEEKVYNQEELYGKLSSFCAYQERTTLEVTTKLKSLNAEPDQIEFVIERLKEDGYLDEARFAGAFVRGKHNGRHWGKTRLKIELKQKGIGAEQISETLDQLDSAAYKQTLSDLLIRKNATLSNETNTQKKLQKISRFAMAKGYESGLIWKLIKELGFKDGVPETDDDES